MSDESPPGSDGEDDVGSPSRPVRCFSVLGRRLANFLFNARLGRTPPGIFPNQGPALQRTPS